MSRAFLQNPPKQPILHLWCVIFILRIHIPPIFLHCSHFIGKPSLLAQKSRTEVRDFCLHLVCQRNLVRAWGLEPQRIAAREPKSRMSTNSIMPASIKSRSSYRFLLPSVLIRRRQERSFRRFTVISRPSMRKPELLGRWAANSRPCVVLREKHK